MRMAPADKASHAMARPGHEVARHQATGAATHRLRQKKQCTRSPRPSRSAAVRARAMTPHGPCSRWSRWVMRHTASTPSTNQSVLPSCMRSYFTHTDKNGGLEEFEHPEKQAITPPARWHLTQQAPRRIVGDAWFSRALGCGEDGLSGRTPRVLNTPRQGWRGEPGLTNVRTC